MPSNSKVYNSTKDTKLMMSSRFSDISSKDVTLIYGEAESALPEEVAIE